MSDQPENIDAQDESSSPYLVVARRYRPQSFGQLVGQGQVATALGNAIDTNRVGHAYLFTGARGVGKTSTARIFSKCLNCETGPTIEPCDQCDICTAIGTGEDIDVLEIDGASNRGIDEIRQLRQYANIRPSRCRYKIYIIDEVHMLTKEAFNALLKTLEEPPGHVKFIFCTTNPEKIPITVLSRCQRFDFAPVLTNEIQDRLRFIVDNEKVEADDEALAFLARRASGSMRDSQSLLEQILSFSTGRITVDSVHQMLGTAPGSRIDNLVKAIVASDAAAALSEIHNAIVGGADIGQMLEQLSGFFRDMMALGVGAHKDLLLQMDPDQADQGKSWADQIGVPRILATMQIFDWALARLKQSTHLRSIVELAVVQACCLSDLTAVSTGIDSMRRIQQGSPAPPKPSSLEKKKLTPVAEQIEQPVVVEPVNHSSETGIIDRTKREPSANQSVAESEIETKDAASNQIVKDSDTEPSPNPTATEISETPGSAEASEQNQNDVVASGENSPKSVFKSVAESMGGMVADFAGNFMDLKAISENHWQVFLENQYLIDMCTRGDRLTQIQNRLSETVGHSIRVEFLVSPEAVAAAKAQPVVRKSKLERIRDVQGDPFIEKLVQVFQAELTDVLPPRPTKK